MKIAFFVLLTSLLGFSGVVFARLAFPELLPTPMQDRLHYLLAPSGH